MKKRVAGIVAVIAVILVGLGLAFEAVAVGRQHQPGGASNEVATDVSDDPNILQRSTNDESSSASFESWGD
jgi:hypothetical protein